MNRFGILAIAGALAISVSAGNRMTIREGLDISARAKTETTMQTIAPSIKLKDNAKLSLKTDIVKPNVEKKLEAKQELQTRFTSKTVKANSISMRKIKPADDEETTDTSIAGQYTIQIGDYYYDDSTGSVNSTATITEGADGQILISCDYFPSDVLATYDSTTGDITFSEMYVGYVEYSNTTFYVNFEPFYWDSTSKNVVKSNWTANFDASTGVITTPADHGFSWLAYTDMELTTPYSYLNVFDVEGLTKKGGNGGGNEGIAGEYTVYIGDWYWDDSALATLTYTATIEESNGYILISCEDYFPADVLATYDSTTGDITFSEMYVGSFNYSNTTLYVNFEPFYWDSTSKNVVKSNWTANFDASTGVITTPADHGFSWLAYTDEELTTPYTYLEMFDVEGLVKTSGGSSGEDSDNWISIGEATFMDGWVLPAFGIDQTNPEYWYKVPVERNIDNPNLYRLVNPYHYGPLADYNETTRTGYIQFDVTDPDHVVFDVVEAGFAFSELEVSQLYCYNTLTFYCQYMGMTAAQVVSAAGDAIPYTTFKNNVVTLGVALQDDGSYESDACFGIQQMQIAGYGWTDQYGISTNMSASIDLSETSDENNGISDIMNNDNDTSVRFFNLQGIEVANPAKGQVVICVQGDKATKQIAR
ncbi:MAG: hypothetical protein HDS68_09105 [Bacteroidales bacterium]|nr:hypothetical protein [Bacteroidales bacterium]